MAPETSAVRPGESWGHLTLRRDLGPGPRGLVYRAWDPELGQEVVLTIAPDVRTDPAGRDVLHEARVLTKVRHPNLAAVYGAERRDGRAGVWLELVDGETLETALGHVGRFSAREAALIGIDVCAALEAMHEAGVLHRDLTTRQVMRDRGGRIVVIPFGAGRDATTTGRPSLALPFDEPLPAGGGPESRGGWPADRRQRHLPGRCSAASPRGWRDSAGDASASARRRAERSAARVHTRGGTRAGDGPGRPPRLGERAAGSAHDAVDPPHVAVATRTVVAPPRAPACGGRGRRRRRGARHGDRGVADARAPSSGGPVRHLPRRRRDREHRVLARGRSRGVHLRRSIAPPQPERRVVGATGAAAGRTQPVLLGRRAVGVLLRRRHALACQCVWRRAAVGGLGPPAVLRGGRARRDGRLLGGERVVADGDSARGHPRASCGRRCRACARRCGGRRWSATARTSCIRP